MELRVSVAAGAIALVVLGACSKPAEPAKPPAPTTAAAPGAPAAAASSAADAAAAKAFLEGVYAHYAADPAKSNFDPLGKDAAQVFDAEMVRMLADDRKALHGELGSLDGDVLCDCQDYEAFTATIAVQSATAATAKATADFPMFREPHHNEFDLVKENGVWRIHDVRENDQTEQPPGPSLREIVQKELKDLAEQVRTGKPAAGDEAP
jgi:hypothetical protein